MKYQFVRGSLIGMLALGIVLPLGLMAQSKPQYGSLAEALRSAGNLYGSQGPQSVNWTNGGNKYSYTNNDEIHSMDPKTLNDELIFKNQGLTFPGSAKGFEYESFQWSHDSKHLVFKTNLRKIYRRSGISDYYIYDLDSKQLKQAAKDARSAELSPDGSKVGIERGGNMFTYDFATGQEKQLTGDSTSENGIFNGHYDWVYEEEFGQEQAWNWSPDSKYMAFWQFDEHTVPDFQMTNYEGQHPDNIHISIPQVGDANPVVKIGVIDVASGKKVWLTPDETGDFYIPRIYWTSNPDVLAMMTLNRAQNHLKLYFFNVKTGEHHVVMEEQNSTWVAIFNFYTNVNDMIYFPEKSKEFFWVSDRSGYYHIYRYNYDGKLINQVTKGNWDMIKVSGIDPESKKIYYLSAETSGLEQQFYAIKFDGSDKTKLSTVPGFHDINMSPNTKYYLDSYSNVSTPLHVALNDDKGKTLKMLEDNKGVSDFIKDHAYSAPEFFNFKTADGTSLDGYIIKPFNFDPNKKYPVVMTVYGGPESHDVFNSFSADMWQQWLAQNGYIVANVNNRGIANYGSAFMKIVYKQLGKYESNDFAETAGYLAKLPFVDASKMAIMGTSYGGYSTTYTLLTHPGVFSVGIANSPVTDWRLYDDIYTERYMAPLSDNENGYKNSSDMTFAGNLKDHLLLIHSMSDDNVHPANTMQLLTALTNSGKDVDLRIYPPGAHGAAYNWESYILIESVSYQYLERYLKGNCDLPNLNAK
ncbi:dipeptidyl-peptidase-4 [Mucilaginibacter frigoritolerans]|jgi:dipeptidyl-peptidase 4|uniref:Dipeptidyl-peptidase-4 n=1 Tax=Mucilaginibacter frigoritolerans TaxID=652788 RepID=A0A562UFI3_9SPHI|nr:S9 family peptidase [Mucilaginibacter frigoritolerans]TWJ04570.1 dipeptidyl-peptidase-4 [Mucilaginibacter frigoritolerans]